MNGTEIFAEAGPYPYTSPMTATLIGMDIARAKGKLRGKQPKLSDRQQRELCRMHATRRVLHQRSRRALLRLKTNHISHTQPVPSPLAYDPAPLYLDFGDGAERGRPVPPGSRQTVR